MVAFVSESLSPRPRSVVCDSWLSVFEARRSAAAWASLGFSLPVFVFLFELHLNLDICEIADC